MLHLHAHLAAGPRHALNDNRGGTFGFAIDDDLSALRDGVDDRLVGAAAGEITITSDDPDTPSKVLSLSGNSPSAAVSTFIADSGAFADTCAADITDMMLTIDNTGACPLQIDSVTIALGANAQPGDFVTPDGDTAGTTVSSGNSVQVPIRFQPSAFDN